MTTTTTTRQPQFTVTLTPLHHGARITVSGTADSIAATIGSLVSSPSEQDALESAMQAGGWQWDDESDACLARWPVAGDPMGEIVTVIAPWGHDTLEILALVDWAE